MATTNTSDVVCVARLAAIALALAVAGVPGATVEAQDVVPDLFGPPPDGARAGRLLAERGAGIRRGVGLRGDLLRERERIRLNLFDDVAFVATRTRLETRSPTRFSWFGRLEDVAAGQVVIVVEGDDVAANIHHPGAFYAVRTLAPGTFEIRDMGGVPFAPDVMPAPPPAPPEARALSGAADPAEQIDLLVVYTFEAAGAPGIAAEIRLAVDETNLAFANSGLDQRLRLVDARPVAYAESGDGHYDLDQLTFSGGDYALLDAVHDWREETCADLVSMWILDWDEYCGSAWLIDVNGGGWTGFGVVRRVCATGPSYTFAHEIGHNLGACHDRYVDDSCVLFDYSFGYIDTLAGWRTIMAYPDQCTDLGVSCPRIPYWSSSDTFYEGRVTGNPPGHPAAADNKLTFLQTAFTVANFRSTAAGDIDADGVCQGLDNCRFVANPDQDDSDLDGWGDGCDNCVGTPNAGQLDFDADGKGDACENGATLIDADHSGDVDGFDLIVLGMAFGTQQGDLQYDATVDFTRDGWVDGDDLAAMMPHFGANVPPK